MKKKETPLQNLSRFLPKGSFPLVAPYFINNTIHLNLTRERKTVLGDYRIPCKEFPYHRISININLNPYSFLITLLHEIAHMQTQIYYADKVAPHGKEWKSQFRHILMNFIGKGFFPKDVEKALIAYLQNPAASTCTDPLLYKTLYRYDIKEDNCLLVDDVKVGDYFETMEGEVFEKIAQMRTRCKCKHVRTRALYLFHGIIEVKRTSKKRKKIA